MVGLEKNRINFMSCEMHNVRTTIDNPRGTDHDQDMDGVLQLAQ